MEIGEDKEQTANVLAQAKDFGDWWYNNRDDF